MNAFKILSLLMTTALVVGCGGCKKREGPRTRNGKERAGMSRAYAQVYGYDRTWQIVQLRHCAL